MASIKTWSADLGTAQRVSVATSTTKHGSGAGKRFYVGRADSTYQYHGYLRFNLDWTSVGRIINATLTLYADDGNGILGDTFGDRTTEGRLFVRRLTAGFSERTNGAGWTAADAQSVPSTVADQVLVGASVGALEATQVDITAMVEQWAPTTVKRRNGASGGGQANYGVVLFGSGVPAEHWAAVSEDAEGGLAAYVPVVTLTYDLGLTVPATPGSLVPSGAVASLTTFQGTFSDAKPGDELRRSQVEVYTAAATNTGQVVSGGSRLYAGYQNESASAIANAVFEHTPNNWAPVRSTTYKWRARVVDSEGQFSLWTNLVSFSVNNTAPNAPTTTPADASSFASLDGVKFKGTFTDADAGDTCSAYQVQLSTFAEGSAQWDTNELLWDTGKRSVPAGSTTWETVYGGDSLDAGTYYWRARHWDRLGGTVSSWTYKSIVLSANFVVDPAVSTNAVQQRPKAPWRIVIRDMGANRGPGNVVAILEDAMNAGASILYNSPGEAHWTLSPNHPQISVIEPKQTHYAIEFRQGDGWREVYAGLVWDFDATEGDIVFYGIDYLALLDYVMDERYDPSNPDKVAANGGSKYVNDTITEIITSQLTYVRGLSNSPVGFITVGTVDSMTEAITVYATYQPTLNFVVGLLDSHRAGSGKRSRISVRKTSAGGYEFVVEDDPGTTRDNLRLRYGELVQGYRVVPFGKGWGTRVAAIGRDKEGVKVRYTTMTATGISEATWGRFTIPRFFDGVADANDFNRQARQAAASSSKLGRSIGLGIRVGFLQPRDGYDICDEFPVDIEHGSVSTSAFGSGYWAVYGITWQSAVNGNSNVTLTLLPREDTDPPSADLLTLQPISPQQEWQVGWDPPDVVAATSRYWLDQNTGKVYARDESSVTDALSVTGVAATNLLTAASAHGFSAGSIVYFPTLTGGTGLSEDTRYYVIASGLTATAFRVSTAAGGSEVDFSSDVTAGTVQLAPTYTLVSSGAMSPPSTPPTPTAPTVTSSVEGLIVRLEVEATGIGG